MKPFIVVIRKGTGIVSNSIVYMTDLDNEAEEDLVKYRNEPNTKVVIVFDLQDLYRELYC